MKYLLSIIFASFILSVSSFDVDPTDDGVIEYFVTELFNLEDPEKYALVKEEVRQHTDDLLEGVLSLVGEGFEFARDMKSRFNQEFKMEKLQKIIEDIFGTESEIASQLQKHGAEVKQNILDLSDTFMGGSGRAKRQTGVLKEIIDEAIGKKDPAKEKKGKNQQKKKKAKKVEIEIQDGSGDELQVGNGGVEGRREGTGKKLKIQNGDSNQDDDIEVQPDKTSKSDDDSDEKDDDATNRAIDRFNKKANNFTDLAQEVGEDLIHLADKEQSIIINNTKKGLENSKKIVKKLNKNASDFFKDLKDIFKKLSNGLLDLIR